jgi:hypothetical protein
MTIANVALTNTFDEWRTITNQVIVVVNDALSNTARFQSNTSSLKITQNVALGGLVYISANITSNISDSSTVNFAAANTVNTVHGLVLTVNSRVNTTQNLVNTVYSTVNAAFNAANTATSTASINLIFDTANASFDKANAALANSATGTQVFNGNLSIKSTFSVRGTVDTASANIRSQTLTDDVTINWDASQGQIATITLGGNRTLANASNIRVGTYILHVIQDGTGNRTLSFGSQYKWPAGVAPPTSSSSNARDVLMFVSDGSLMYGSFIPDVK